MDSGLGSRPWRLDRPDPWRGSRLWLLHRLEGRPVRQLGLDRSGLDRFDHGGLLVRFTYRRPLHGRRFFEILWNMLLLNLGLVQVPAAFGTGLGDMIVLFTAGGTDQSPEHDTVYSKRQSPARIERKDTVVIEPEAIVGIEP